MKESDKHLGEAFEWLQYVLKSDEVIPIVSDWEALYQFADKQKIIGVCNPLNYNVQIGVDLVSIWMGSVIQIKAQNALVSKRAIEVCEIWKNAGFRCCVLKGQGNAEMYPDPSLRMPGDIDLWIDADEETIRDFVTKQYPDAKECYKHIKYPVFDDVEVDVHQTPLKFGYPLHQKRFQKWIKQYKDEQFLNRIQLTGTEGYVSVPTAKFNAVYQLGHIMEHLFDEGVGFRQLIDYFYVLKELEGLLQEERDEIVNTWKRLGMLRLASAVMWIESEVLGMPERYLLTTPNRRLGKSMLEDVLEGGNFGHYSERQKYHYRGKRLAKRVASLRRLLKISLCSPGEAAFRIPHRFVILAKADWRRILF